jgi:hypothetical protein
MLDEGNRPQREDVSQPMQQTGDPADPDVPTEMGSDPERVGRGEHGLVPQGSQLGAAGRRRAQQSRHVCEPQIGRTAVHAQHLHGIERLPFERRRRQLLQPLAQLRAHRAAGIQGIFCVGVQPIQHKLATFRKPAGFIASRPRYVQR